MKALLCIFCFFIASSALCQNNIPLVTTAGIGEVKVGMTREALEKLTGQKLVLKHLRSKKDDAPYQDTFRISHKDVELEVMMQKSYSEKNPDEVTVYEVKSSNALLKTKSGITIGDDKLKIVSTYNDYTLHLFPYYDPVTQAKSKTKSTVWLFADSSENVIIFYLENNKVTGFSVMVGEGC